MIPIKFIGDLQDEISCFECIHLAFSQHVGLTHYLRSWILWRLSVYTQNTNGSHMLWKADVNTRNIIFFCTVYSGCTKIVCMKPSYLQISYGLKGY